MKPKPFQITVIILLSVILLTVILVSTVKKEKTPTGSSKFTFMGKKVYESKPK